MTARSLRSVLENEAATLEAAEARSTATGLEWSIEGIVFAATDKDRAEFRLAPAIAAAALRTPDTAPSPRGPDWVVFEPPSLDAHAIDRAAAWLGSAWRRADGET